MDFSSFLQRDEMPDHSGCSKKPSPPLTEKLDRLMDCTSCVFGWTIYVSMYSIQTYHTDERFWIMRFWNYQVSSRYFKYQASLYPSHRITWPMWSSNGWFVSFFFWFSRLVTSSEPLRLMDRNTSHTTWWCLEPGFTHFFLVEFQRWNPIDRPNWLLYAFHRNAVKWLFWKETSPLWNTDSFMLEIHQMDNLATIPIISIHVLLAWYSRPCLACHGSWRDASEGLQSAAWWLDSPIYRPMAKPKQGFIGWNKSLGARCRFSVEFWHFGLRRLWMSPDAILPHLTSDQTLRCENASHFITHVLVCMTPL